MVMGLTSIGDTPPIAVAKAVRKNIVFSFDPTHSAGNFSFTRISR